MGMTYDPDDPLLSSLRTMLNYEGFLSRSPAKSFTYHANPTHTFSATRFVQHDSLNAMSDIGVFYLATNANPTTGVVGQLYIEYDIVFYTSRPNTLAATVQYWGANRVTASSGTYGLMPCPAGAIAPDQLIGSTNLATWSLTGSNGSFDTITFTAPGYYTINVRVTSSTLANAAVSNMGITVTNGTDLTFNFVGANENNAAGGVGVGFYVIDASAWTPALPTKCQWPTTITLSGSDTLYSSVVIIKQSQYPTAPSNNPAIDSLTLHRHVQNNNTFHSDGKDERVETPLSDHHVIVLEPDDPDCRGASDTSRYRKILQAARPL
jgi:hypothetical protein